MFVYMYGEGMYIDRTDRCSSLWSRTAFLKASPPSNLMHESSRRMKKHPGLNSEKSDPGAEALRFYFGKADCGFRHHFNSPQEVGRVRGGMGHGPFHRGPLNPNAISSRRGSRSAEGFQQQEPSKSRCTGQRVPTCVSSPD